MTPTPFLYEELMVAFRDASGDHQHYVIHSGRSLGKTTVLRRIADRMRNGGWQTTCFTLIRGRAPSATESVLNWVEEPEGTLLIDDLDQLSSIKIAAVFHDLRTKEGDWHVIASSCNPRVVEQFAPLEPGDKAFEPVRLDPWQGDWQRASSKAIEDALEAFLSSPDTPSIPKDVVISWREVILEVSGGHPALIGAAFDRLVALLRASATSRLSPAECRLLEQPAEEDTTRWRNAIRVHIEDFLVDKELPIICHAIRTLQPCVFDHLVRLAQGESRVDSAIARKQLRDTGLVYTDHGEGHLVVASPLLREWILYIAEEEDGTLVTASSAAPSSITHLELIGSNSYDGIMEYMTTGGDSREISVSGASWRLLRCLSEAEGEPLSVLQLAEDANLGSEAATRSAVQRLQRLLKDNRLDHILDNVRGRGYRLKMGSGVR